MGQQIQEVSGFNPLAAGILLLMVGLVWGLPRRYAICPLLVITCLMPLGQEIVVAGLHFQCFRVVLLVGALRVIAKGEAAQMSCNRLDKIFILWVIVSLTFGCLSKPSTELFVNRLGDAYNACGCYFLARCLMQDMEDIVIGVLTLAWLSLPLAGVMLTEKLTGHNLLAVFGGVPEITIVREGHLRCQGAFRHPILAGTFGATQLPLFIALGLCWQQYRRLAAAAVLSALVIVVTSSSSGALMAVTAAGAGLAFWRWRSHMRLVRWTAALTVLGLAMVMKAPVWYLLAKLGNAMGGTGWHRAYLIDQAVAHFDEWWLFGTTYTAHWGPAGLVIAADPNMMDITNHYIMEGVKGGLSKLTLFLVIIVLCFKSVGRWLRASTGEQITGFFVWALGVSLFAHCVSFISITYFDQIIVIWYWVLAALCLVADLSGEWQAGPRTADLAQPENVSRASQFQAPLGV